MYNYATESFHTNNLCSRLCQTEIEFYSQKGQTRFLNHTLGDLEVIYAFHLQLVGKHVIDFLLVILNFFPSTYS